MRRLPVYFLIESSSISKSEVPYILEDNISAFISKAKSSALLIEDLAISFIRINSKVKQLNPLTYLSELQLPMPLVESSGTFDLKNGLNCLNEIITNDKILPYHPRYSGSKPLVILFLSSNSITGYKEEISKLKPDIGLFISYALRNEIEQNSQNTISNYGVNSINRQLEVLPIFFEWLIKLIENRLQHFTEYIIPALPLQLTLINTKKQ
jgi:uncharacterized protein YegL